MAFHLKGFRSLWGTPSAAKLGLSASSKDAATYGDQLLARIALQGFNGIEASLSDLDAIGGPQVVNELLQKHELQLIVGVYSGWTDYETSNLPQQFDSVSTHLERYRKQMELVTACYPEATWINAHAGSDHWGKLNQLEFLAHAMEIEERLGIHKLSYETHRGRIFYSPWPTLELLEAFPSLKLTLDLSHWCVVTERLLDSEQDDLLLWQRVLPHVYHVHGRVGTAQSSQIQHLPGGGNHQESERFEKMWQRVWSHQYARFTQADLVKQIDPVATARAFTTFTPEYGPAPYAPLLRGATEGEEEQDGYDVDLLCDTQMKRQRERFDEFLVDRKAEQAAKDAA